MDLNQYIKTKYPQIIFEPFKFEMKRALGFIISGGKLVIGYINKDGTLCKLINPVDLELLTNGQFHQVISKLPVVDGFTEQDKEKLMSIVHNNDNVTQIEHEQVVGEIQDLVNSEDKQTADYNVVAHNDNIVLIRKEYQDIIDKLRVEIDTIQKQFSKCQTCQLQILNEKPQIIAAIQEYRAKLIDYLKDKELSISDLKNVIVNAKSENNTLISKLNALSNVSNDNTELAENIETIKNELDKTRQLLSDSETQRSIIDSRSKKCIAKIMSEKNLIIQTIQEYNTKWKDWLQKNLLQQHEYDASKQKLVDELNLLRDQLILLKQQKMDDNESAIQLKRDITDIQSALDKTIAEQLIDINTKEAKIQELEIENQELKQTVSYNKEEMDKLQDELAQVKRLISENQQTKVQAVDKDSCFDTLKSFSALNNIFYRKQEIIARLEKIIDGSIGMFTQLDESAKQQIINKFTIVKSEILKHISFLDLEKYVKSPNFDLLKNKATRTRVPDNFCTELTNILEYWNANKADYREQDKSLSNIYEDLSGAVRVYVRIKPQIGVDDNDKAVDVYSIQQQKQKSVVLECNGIEENFGDFYGVFDEGYANADLYTGVTNIYPENYLYFNTDQLVDANDSISPGLYSAFKQVEDGYHVVLFGYGLSGSGKTFSLLGENSGSRGNPGVIHYGLANLQNVANIKIKHVFEQYLSAVDPNFGKIRGKIHNLIRELPQLRQFSVNETEIFAKGVPENIDVNHLSVNDLFNLTSYIEKYRTTRSRIKRTPNNPVSSRSHLYIVFEITFENGVVGYITVIDTAGRESPLDIYNMFLDTSKVTLASVMAPSGGTSLINQFLKDDSYDPKQVLEILKEGFYINETINHLIYFFNKKNYKQTSVRLQSQDVSKYTVQKYYVKPFEEEVSIKESNNCLTIPIMSFLDSLSKRNKQQNIYKPTKFIMLCMARQEAKYCNPTRETLQFANSIKST